MEWTTTYGLDGWSPLGICVDWMDEDFFAWKCQNTTRNGPNSWALHDCHDLAPFTKCCDVSTSCERYGAICDIPSHGNCFYCSDHVCKMGKTIQGFQLSPTPPPVVSQKTPQIEETNQPHNFTLYETSEHHHLHPCTSCFPTIALHPLSSTLVCLRSL